MFLITYLPLIGRFELVQYINKHVQYTQTKHSVLLLLLLFLLDPLLILLDPLLLSLPLGLLLLPVVEVPPAPVQHRGYGRDDVDEQLVARQADPHDEPDLRGYAVGEEQARSGRDIYYSKLGKPYIFF